MALRVNESGESTDLTGAVIDYGKEDDAVRGKVEAVAKAKAEYDSLPPEVKEEVDSHDSGEGFKKLDKELGGF